MIALSFVYPFKTSELLPVSLSHLTIGNFCELVCEHLPTGLKTLRAQKTLMSPNMIKFLPKSLTNLSLSFTRHDNPWFDIDTGKKIGPVTKLPEYTIHQNCSLSSFDWKDYSSIPPTLTLCNLSNEYKLGDSFLLCQQLPNLQELFFEESKHFTDLSILLLPPNLTALRIPYLSMISGISFRFLPRHLTSLDLTYSESIFDSDIQHLHELWPKLAWIRQYTWLTCAFLDLPQHLEELAMMYNSLITPCPSFPNLSDILEAINRPNQRNGVSTRRIHYEQKITGWFTKLVSHYWGQICLLVLQQRIFVLIKDRWSSNIQEKPERWTDVLSHTYTDHCQLKLYVYLLVG